MRCSLVNSIYHEWSQRSTKDLRKKTRRMCAVFWKTWEMTRVLITVNRRTSRRVEYSIWILRHTQKHLKCTPFLRNLIAFAVYMREG